MTSRASKIGAVLAIFLGIQLVGCSTPNPPPPEEDPLDQAVYVIGEADVVEVRVWDNPAVSTTVPVRPDGRISVPLLDDVQAAGLTPLELKEVVSEALKEYIAAPDVTILIRTINSKRIFLMGEVGRNGPIALTQDLRILDALAAAGGFTNFADKSNVRLLRNTGGVVHEYIFDYKAFIQGKNPEANIRLVPGDTIVVSD